MKVKLECGHTATFNPDPLPGDPLWCYECGNYRIWDGADRWQVLCRKCGFSRYAGERRGVEAPALSHAIKYPGHVLDLTCAGAHIDKVSNPYPTLPVAWVNEHQRSLRALSDRYLRERETGLELEAQGESGDATPEVA